MNHPHIVIIGADKGGVGKTFLARLSLDYLEQRPEQLEHRAFDAQAPAGILRRFHPERTLVVDIRKSDDQVKIFDGLRPGQVTVIDLAAGELSYMLGLVGELGFLDDVRAGKLKITVLHVIGSTQASLDEIASVRQLVAGARHFLVTNHINGSAYTGLSEQLRAQADGVIDIPQLDATAAEAVDRAGTSFAAFVANEGNSLTLRRYVQAWLGKCFAAFQAAGAH